MSQSPTIGFSINEADRPRLDRLVHQYAHGNRSEWLRQALDLYELRELFDTLARLQALGDQAAAQAGHTPATLADAVAEALRHDDLVAARGLVAAALGADAPERLDDALVGDADALARFLHS